jgi:hypothetical protein
MRESLDEMITKWDLDKTKKELNIQSIERNDLLSFWRDVNVHCNESIIDENIKRDHVLITSLNPWTLNQTFIVDLSFPA